MMIYARLKVHNFGKIEIDELQGGIKIVDARKIDSIVVYYIYID